MKSDIGGTNMLQNNVYNLMEQITEESRSLWRIRNSYLRDSEGCKECLDFWRKLAQDKEQHIHDLENLIKVHLPELEIARR